MKSPSLVAEIEVYQRQKAKESICGDAFYLRKLSEENRVLAVLSDGLGSGVKANVLATMTSRMALRFVASNMPIGRCADIIMDALPVCRVRKISYATFTIVDSTLHGRTRIIEMGNPPFLLVRQGQIVSLPTRVMQSERWKGRDIRLAEIDMQPQDRLVIFSDGVSQAGIGSPHWPLGWRVSGGAAFVERRVREDPAISARCLAREVVYEALRKEVSGKAGDDMSCAVMYYRRPRRLMVLSGPPFDQSRDKEIARRLSVFNGRRAVCGGTTANIVARELGRQITTKLRGFGSDLPPASTMPGVDLVTEGILTLTRAAQYLESGVVPESNSAAQLVELLRESDVIEFMVGTRINEAHQDPSLPVDLEIRRNIVKRIARSLEMRYLKQVDIKYI